MKLKPDDPIRTNPLKEVKFRFEIMIGNYRYARGIDELTTRAHAFEQLEAFHREALTFMGSTSQKPARRKGEQ